jgi:hypothetical protein
MRSPLWKWSPSDQPSYPRRVWMCSREQGLLTGWPYSKPQLGWVGEFEPQPRERRLFRATLDHVHTKGRAPGVPDSEDFRLAEVSDQVFGDFNGILCHAANGQGAASSLSVLGESASCTALIPTDDREMFLPRPPSLRHGAPRSRPVPRADTEESAHQARRASESTSLCRRSGRTSHQPPPCSDSVLHQEPALAPEPALPLGHRLGMH